MRAVFVADTHTVQCAEVSNQAARVADIIDRDGGITRMTAFHYQIANVTARIAELRKAGFQVLCEKRIDGHGKTYGRWTFPAGAEVMIA
jgi:hypothetical protein